MRKTFELTLDDEEMAAAVLEWYRQTEGEAPSWVSDATFDRFDRNTVSWALDDDESLLEEIAPEPTPTDNPVSTSLGTGDADNG